MKDSLKTRTRPIYFEYINPFTEEQLNLLDTVPKQAADLLIVLYKMTHDVRNVRFCGALNC